MNCTCSKRLFMWLSKDSNEKLLILSHVVLGNSMGWESTLNYNKQ